MTEPHKSEQWRRALEGDRDAFEASVAPYLAPLRGAAARLLALNSHGGRGTELTTEELLGETLLRAFDQRTRFEQTGMSFRAWLLGLQSRALALYEHRESEHASKSLVSMDEVVPTGDSIDAVEEDWWEFRQPFDVVTYEDVIAGTEPRDLDLAPIMELSEETTRLLVELGLPADAAHAVVLHDEFDVSIAETAQILNASIKDTTENLNAARASLRDRRSNA